MNFNGCNFLPPQGPPPVPSIIGRFTRQHIPDTHAAAAPPSPVNIRLRVTFQTSSRHCSVCRIPAMERHLRQTACTEPPETAVPRVPIASQVYQLVIEMPLPTACQKGVRTAVVVG